MSDTSALFDQHWDRGFELFRQDKFLEAIAEWQEASRLDPEDGYPLHLIGPSVVAARPGAGSYRRMA